MSKLGNISGKQAVKALERAGWAFSSQVGSHVVMTKPGQRANLTIPQHKELAIGTIRAIVRSAGMTVDEFLAFL